MNALSSFVFVSILIFLSNFLEMRVSHLLRGINNNIRLVDLLKSFLRKNLKQKVKVSTNRKLELNFLPILLLLVAYIPFCFLFLYDPIHKDDSIIRSSILSFNFDMILVMLIPVFISIIIIYLSWATRSKIALIESIEKISFKMHYLLVSVIVLGPLLIEYNSVNISEIIQKQSVNGLKSWGIIRQPLSFFLFFLSSLIFYYNLEKLIRMKKYIYSNIIEYSSHYSSNLIFQSIKLTRLALSLIITYLFFGGYLIPFSEFLIGKEFNSILLLLSVFFFIIKILLINFLYIIFQSFFQNLSGNNSEETFWRIIYPLSYLNLLYFLRNYLI